MTKILKQNLPYMRSLKFLLVAFVAGCIFYSCDLVNADSVLVEHVVNDDIYTTKEVIHDTFYIDKIILKWDTVYIEQWYIDTIYIDGEIIYDTIYIEVPYYIEVPVYDTVFIKDTKIIYIEVPGECPLKLEVISARLENGNFFKRYRLSPSSAGSGCNKPYVRMSFFKDQGFVFPTETFVNFLSGFYLQGNGLTNIKGTLNGSMEFEVEIHCPSGDEALRMTIDTDGGGHIDDVTLLIW